MARLLTDAEKLTGQKYDMNNLSDVYEAIHAIQGQIGITGTTAKEASTTFTGSFNAMKASAKNLLGQMALGEDMQPAFDALLNTTSNFFLNNFIPMLTNIFKSSWNIIKYVFSDLIPQMTTGLQEQYPTLIAKGGEIIGNLITGILQALPTVIESLGGFIVGMLGAFYQQLPNFLATGARLVLSIIDGIVQNLPAIVQSAVNVISQFIATVQNNWPTIMQKGAEIIMKLVTGIIQRLPDIIAASVKIIGILVQGLVSNIPKIVSTGVQILVGLVRGILSTIGQVISAMAKVTTTIIKSVTGIDLSGAGRAIIQGFIDGMVAVWETGKSFISGIAGWIKDHKGPIEYDRKLLIPAGNAIMSGLHDGLKDMFNNKVKPLVGGMADDMMNTFGNPQLAFDMTANAQSNIPNYDLSTNKLANQLSNTPSDYTNSDLMSAILNRNNEQIVVSLQVDKQEVARLFAKPIDNVITKDKAALARLRGEI